MIKRLLTRYIVLILGSLYVLLFGTCSNSTEDPDFVSYIRFLHLAPFTEEVLISPSDITLEYENFSNFETIGPGERNILIYTASNSEQLLDTRIEDLDQQNYYTYYLVQNTDSLLTAVILLDNFDGTDSLNTARFTFVNSLFETATEGLYLISPQVSDTLVSNISYSPLSASRARFLLNTPATYDFNFYLIENDSLVYSIAAVTAADSISYTFYLYEQAGTLQHIIFQDSLQAN